MRKIKHFAGYGCVMAEHVKDTKGSLHIRVLGLHERGLRPYCLEDAYRWLVPRFDGNAPEYYDQSKGMSIRYKESIPGTCNERGMYIEQIDYYFSY